MDFGQRRFVWRLVFFEGFRDEAFVLGFARALARFCECDLGAAGDDRVVQVSVVAADAQRYGFGAFAERFELRWLA